TLNYNGEKEKRNIKEEYNKQIDKILIYADQILNRKINIFGKTVNIDNNINWHKDYNNGYVWTKDYYKEIEIINNDNKSDIKYPWELSRFHHGLFLAMAYNITLNEKYAQDIIKQYNDWLNENKLFYGINWTCTMEVSIRAINLIWCLLLINESSIITNTIYRKYLLSIYCHGLYIYHHPEINYRLVEGRIKRVCGNHYIADLVGLLIISVYFPEFKGSKRWFKYAIKNLEKEIKTQFDADGVHYEYSLNYHRLVLELILLAIIILKKHKIKISNDILTTASKSIDFILHYSKPDGNVPLIRDIDNGRILIFGDEHYYDHRHLIDVGAVLLDNICYRTGHKYQDILWLFGDNGQKVLKSIPVIKNIDIKSKGYKNSGMFVMRDDNLHMLAICSKVGMHGYCGHTHNDFLSFELYAYDKTFLTDSGSYVYSQSPKWRNKFRSTSSHNTVCIDNHEMNEIAEDNVFGIGNTANPKILQWQTTNNIDLLSAEYTLSITNLEIIKHRRDIVFDKINKYWIIRDQLSGNSKHSVKTFYHFDHGVDVERIGQNDVETKCESSANLKIIAKCNNKIELKIGHSWISKIYGNKKLRKVAIFKYDCQLPLETVYFLIPIKQGKELPIKLDEYKSYDEIAKMYGEIL
ncbi:alginate lyase family protein, partial [Thermodesulfobacteriota bacterium]